LFANQLRPGLLIGWIQLSPLIEGLDTQTLYERAASFPGFDKVSQMNIKHHPFSLLFYLKGNENLFLYFSYRKNNFIFSNLSRKMKYFQKNVYGK